jgi:hypothetical protein
MTKRLLLVTGAALLMLGIVTPAQANHAWENYHWSRGANPFNVTLVDGLDSTWDAYLPPVSSDWSQSQVLDTSITTGASDLLTRSACQPIAGKVFVCNANYGPNLWLGLATIWLSGDHITQGTVQVNDFYFGQAQYNNTAERRHVLCQEVGHTFGLAHQSENGDSLNTCMDYYSNVSNSDTKSTTPNAHDYDQLNTIYSHLDGTGGGGGGGGNGGCHGKKCGSGANTHDSHDMIVTHQGDVTIIQFIYWL